MDALMRICGAVAALGAALIALAVGAAAPVWIAVLVLAAGAGQLAVAVLALRGSPLPGPAILAPFAAPTAVWLAALVAAPAAASSLPLGPMLAETGLALGAAALLALGRRTSAEPRALPALLAVAASAAVVATVATAALAGTNAGAFAQPHGEHGAAVDAPADEPALEGPVLVEHSGH
jgi:hypothetical protein